MFCKICTNRHNCIKICTPLEKYLKKHVEVARIETLECELGINLEEIVEEMPYPEGEIELDLYDWKFFVKNYDMTSNQRRFIFLKFWRNKSFKSIGKICNTSPQNIHQTLNRFIEKVDKNLSRR